MYGVLAMADFSDKVSLRNYKKINEAFKPLQEALGVNYFYYSGVSNKGIYTALSSNPDWNRYWHQERLYLQSYSYLQPEHYRIGKTICLPSLEEDFKHVQRIAREKFNIHYVLEVVSRDHLGIESFGFSSDKLDHTTISQFLTDLPCLKLFFKLFRTNHQEIFRQLKESHFNLGQEIGPPFFHSTQKAPQMFYGSDFLRDIGILILDELSDREREICGIITRGLSAREIAEDLELSKRTVESYIETIKVKLNCFTKAELVQKCLDLEAIGYTAGHKG
jgi:DNA-binding CsgD family transcriptional regulator